VTAADVVAISLVAAPLCAAGLNLAPPRRVALLLLFGVFAGSGASIALGQQVRIGLGLLATGGVACAILAIGFERAGWPRRGEGHGPVPGGRFFRAATVLFVAAAAWGVAAPSASATGALAASRLTSAVMILAMGLLQLGLSQEQGAAALGLLTALAGFEVFYTGLEPSLALRAVLAAIMLGIALVSSVLLEMPGGAGEGSRAG
jgi:hypothetical protein